VIAVDTNILVYGRRSESVHHAAARKLLLGLAEGDESWALPWPCVYEYVRVVTHPRVFDPPSDLGKVLDDLASVLESPSLSLLGEGPTHPSWLFEVVNDGAATGNLAHDAHIAALCREHGVQELWTTDRDFRRFGGLHTRDPFAEPAVHERRARYSRRRG
jgi:toxin-antitoxin system PIN domain toxin